VSHTLFTCSTLVPVVRKFTLTVGDFGKRQGEKGLTTWVPFDWIKLSGQSKTGLKDVDSPKS
jgi:hypothetical protein